MTTKVGGEDSCVVLLIVVQWLSAAVHAVCDVRPVSVGVMNEENLMSIIR